MKTIQNDATFLLEIEKSKFYAFAFHCDDVELFKLRLSQIKKDNPKAKHVVYGYRIGNASKSTDDGEPKGTAGRPILELLNLKDLTDTALIIVRYFGGTKLGASRLLRTYMKAASSALNKAEEKEN